MKYTNMEITSIYEKLTTVYKSQIAFPAKVAYCIVRDLKILASIYDDILEAREKLIRDNSEIVDNCYKVLPEKQEYVTKELSSLGEAENEISLSMIKMKDIEDLNLPVNIMDGLFYIIKDEG